MAPPMCEFNVVTTLSEKCCIMVDNEKLFEQHSQKFQEALGLQFGSPESISNVVKPLSDGTFLFTLKYKAGAVSWDAEVLSMHRKLKDLGVRITTCVQGFGLIAKFVVGPLELHLPHEGFFSTTPTSAHLAVKTDSMDFGGMPTPGQLVSHWRVGMEDGPEAETSIEVLRGWNQGSPNISSAMIANFMHDREYLEVVYGEKLSARDRRSKPVDEITAIRIPYKQISRIICSPKNDSQPCRLAFVLESPVEMTRHTRRDAQKCSRERIFELDRGRTVKDEPHPDAIAYSETVMIALSKDTKFSDVFSLLGRILQKTKKPIEFFNLETELRPYWAAGKRNGYCYLTPPSSPAFKWPNQGLLHKWKQLELEFFVMTVLSICAAFRDQLLPHGPVGQAAWARLLRILTNHSAKDHESTMRRLYKMQLDRSRAPDILRQIELALAQEENEDDVKYEQRLINEGHVFVRSVIQTPTRRLYLPPEPQASNRVFRRFLCGHDENRRAIPIHKKVFRVYFKDDNFSLLFRNTLGDAIVDKTARNTLNRGISIGETLYEWLGQSNSQLREQGYYFVDSAVKPEEIRSRLGNFNTTLFRQNIPKRLAREGQCFSQSQACSFKLYPEEVIIVKDVEGGCDTQGKQYVFSDGCGLISPDLANRIAEDLGIWKVRPSCFQIRYGGVKGVVAVDPLFENKMLSIGEDPTQVHAMFSKSMWKFNMCPGYEDYSLEIVKWSAPSPVVLSKQWINILDQVSEGQGDTVFNRVTSRILAYLDAQVERLTRAFIENEACAELLRTIKCPIDLDYLKSIAISEEPFFRRMTVVKMKAALRRLQNRESIEIPAERGRSLLGVMDWDGYLEPGQVYIQVARDVHCERKDAKHDPITGPVMVTKAPMIMAGDVRVFEAVDIPELAHNRNVIVFPRTGERPHPNELAGSDLDGDEYFAIWDQDLLFDYNEEPLDYVASQPELNTNDDIKEAQIDHLSRLVGGAIVGTFANAHLVLSDLQGIKAKAADELARKHSIVIDFTKAGGDLPELTQAEKSRTKPDFLNRTFEPNYKSDRLTGQIFREVSTLRSLIETLHGTTGSNEIELDSNFVLEGWELFEEDAKKLNNRYMNALKSLMDQFGIESEAELMSGNFLGALHRVNDNDDRSYFNKEKMIRDCLRTKLEAITQDFFKDFGGEEVCRPVNEFDQRQQRGKPPVCTKEILVRMPNLRLKASALYVVAYAKAMTSGEEPTFLGCPWLFFDILQDIKEDRQPQRSDPIFKRLKDKIEDYCVENRPVYNAAALRWSQNSMVYDYIQRNIGLSKVMFVLSTWAARAAPTIPAHLIPQLVILFATGHWPKHGKAGQKFFDKLTPQNLGRIYRRQPLDMGRLFLDFMQFAASRALKDVATSDFADFGDRSGTALDQTHLAALHTAAVTDYYSLLITKEVACIPLANDPISITTELQIECPSFVVELPVAADLRLLENRLIELADVSMVEMRQDEVRTYHSPTRSTDGNNNNRFGGNRERGGGNGAGRGGRSNNNRQSMNNRQQTWIVVVSARGSPLALQHLRELLTPPKPANSENWVQTAKKLYEGLLT